MCHLPHLEFSAGSWHQPSSLGNTEAVKPFMMGEGVCITRGTFLQVLPAFRLFNSGQLVSMEGKAKILEHGRTLLIICFVVVLYLKLEELEGFLYFELQASNSQVGAVLFSP